MTAPRRTPRSVRGAEEDNAQLSQEDIPELTESRYQRQATLLQDQGWDQTKLTNARVAVIGSNCLANYAALTLSAFGFGTVELYGQGILQAGELACFQPDNALHTLLGDSNYAQGFLYFEAQEGTTKAKALEEIIHKINPEITFRGINLGLQREENAMLMGKPDLIVEATNDPESKCAVMNYARSLGIPVVSMAAGKDKGGVGVFTAQSTMQKFENLLFYELAGQEEDPVVAQVIAGVGIEEARKVINPLERETVVDDLIIYNLLSHKRFDHEENKAPPPSYDLSEKSVCLIGAGALGNFVGLALALRNIGKLVIVDFDTTEITNLNRQVLLYEGVGQYKAEALVEKLQAINPRSDISAIIEKITPDSAAYFQTGEFDLVMDTVDNNKTRALLNFFATTYDIPFISGGTRYNSGQVNIYVPGKSACLDCQADIDKLALGNARRQSCIYAAQPSVITSNQITGGLMVGEATTVLHPERYGDFARGEIKFVSSEEYRLGVLPSPKDNCDCRKDLEKLAAWPKKMQGVYDDS